MLTTTTKNNISIGASVSAGLTSVPNTDTQTTERATSVAVDRIHVMHAMRPNINIDGGEAICLQAMVVQEAISVLSGD